MAPLPWLLVSALAMAADTRPLEVRADGGAVTIRAENLPVSQILDRLSAATGMNLTYEGTRPTTPVTMSVEGISEAEAILKLMEGLGVSYVFRTDATGQRVDLLIVSGAGTGKLVAAAQTASPAEPEWEEPVPDYGQIPLDPAVLEAAGPQTRPDFNNPYLGLPPQHFPPGTAPPVQPPQDVTGSNGSRNVPAPPSIPKGVSYPR